MAQKFFDIEKLNDVYYGEISFDYDDVQRRVEIVDSI